MHEPPGHRDPSPSPQPLDSAPDMHEQLSHLGPSSEPPDRILIGPRTLDDEIALGLDSAVDGLQKTARFINALHGATLEQSNMQQEDIDRLHATEPNLCFNITEKHFLKALCTFLCMRKGLLSRWYARPCRQFATIPLGPVIQALYGSLEMADLMHYRGQTTADILEYAQMHGGKAQGIQQYHMWF